MANRMEEHTRKTEEYKCPCGKGTYLVADITYMDDYFNKDYATERVMKCPSCSKEYKFLDYHGWVKVKEYDKVQTIKNELEKVTTEAHEYALSQYRKKMIEFLSKQPKKAWWEKWRGLPYGRYSSTLPTFRSHYNKRGLEKFFDDETKNSIFFHRVMSIFSWMEIQDSKIEQYLQTIQPIKHKFEQVDQKLKNSAFNGVKINSK